MSSSDVKITVDNKEVIAEFKDLLISIDIPLNFGVHRLVVENLTGKRFIIKKAVVGDCNLRKLFYLSWLTTAEGERVQPCNEFWGPGQQWILPFGYPVSNWLSMVEQKFKNGVLGGDLYKDHWIWYPESVELEESTPQIIKDFFEYNFDFTVVNKKNFTYEEIPYTKYTTDIDQELISQAHYELKNNQDLINLLAKVPGQKKENAEDFGYADNQQWQSLLLYRQESLGLAAVNHLERFPACKKLIDGLNVPYWYIFIGIMPPNSIVYPHVDDLPVGDPKYTEWCGCTQLYIPLYQPANSYFKIADAGVLDSNSGVMVINNDMFTHAAVNNSSEYRYMLAVRTNREQISKLSISC